MPSELDSTLDSIRREFIRRRLADTMPKPFVVTDAMIAAVKLSSVEDLMLFLGAVVISEQAKHARQIAEHATATGFTFDADGHVVKRD